MIPRAGYAGRHVDVEAVHIHVITAPGEILAVGANYDAGEIVDGPGGPVVARNPLRIFERQRTGGHRYLQMSMQQMARRVGEIYVQENWRGRGLCHALPGREEQADAGKAQKTFVHFLIISQGLAWWSSRKRLFHGKCHAAVLRNHARFDPLFHFVLAPLSLVAIIVSVILFVQHPRLASGLWVVFAIGFFMVAFKTRTYALKVQDRVIRLEERLRLSMLLPEADRARIAELTESQLIALRFASDAELPRLAMRALNEGLTSKQIKTSIESWRADYFRV